MARTGRSGPVLLGDGSSFGVTASWPAQVGQPLADERKDRDEDIQFERFGVVSAPAKPPNGSPEPLSGKLEAAKKRPEESFEGGVRSSSLRRPVDGS